MKKIWLLALIITGSIVNECLSNTWNENNNSEQKNIEFANETGDVWTPTLQLCWNELIDLTGTPQIQYINGNPPLADKLNQQKFFKSDLNSNDYYTSVGKMTITHKNKIAEAIKQKFDDSSDILDAFLFEDVPDEESDEWFIYSILKKDFPFVAEYDILEPDIFNHNEMKKYKYFGFKSGYSPAKELNKQKISEIFYADDEDFALKITDKSGKEEMILYLTSSEASFDDIYNEILTKAKNKEEYLRKRIQQERQRIREEIEQEESAFPGFRTRGSPNPDVGIETHAYYKIPYLHIDEELNFTNDLLGTINSNYGIMAIVKVLQTIKFDLDNKGAHLKSEAGMGLYGGLAPADRTITIVNNYYFDRPFVIFLKEADKDKPYFAARIKDGKYLVEAEDNYDIAKNKENEKKPLSEEKIMALFN